MFFLIINIPNKNFTGWSKNDVNNLKKHFARFIKKGIYPTGEEIKVFIKKTQMKRTVAVIKSKIQHLIKLSKE